MGGSSILIFIEVLIAAALIAGLKYPWWIYF